MSRHSRATRLVLAPAPPLPPEPATVPADTLLDQIAAGDLDAHLTPIAEAIRARFDLLQTVNSAKALAQLTIGDRVRINHHATPRYLHGITGTIVHLDHKPQRSASTSLGRFSSGEIRCPPLVLDRLQPHAITGPSHQPHQPNRPRTRQPDRRDHGRLLQRRRTLTGFEAAFDEQTTFPIPGIVIGETIQVLSVSTISRKELIATCQRAGKRHDRAARHQDHRRPTHLTPHRRLPPLARVCQIKGVNAFALCIYTD